MTDALGPYQIIGELGRGAMAVVWRGFDTRLEREVALKEPLVTTGVDPSTASELALRFVREGQAAAKLNHPGIVTVYAADVFDGRPAIVMELIEGQTLGEILESGPLTEHAATAILGQLLEAVAYAHSRGVVHRDIKPDNVFVTHEGRVKLTDFGIAHLGSSSVLTQAGTVMGTPGYMSPEQITGGACDARSDIFAIGVIGYEMLTGTNPFGASSAMPPTTVMYRIVHEETPMLVHPNGVDSHISQVVAVAMCKDPFGRFQSAEAMRQGLAGGVIDIQGVGSGAAGSAATIVSPAVQHSKGRSWIPYAAVAGVGAFIIAGLLLLSGGPPTQAGNASGVATQQAETVIPPGGAGAQPEAAPEPAEPVVAVPDPVPDHASAVASTVEGWRSSWEGENLGSYMSYYASDFYSAYKRMNRSQWQDYKSKLFAKYAYQTIRISTPSVSVTGNVATATFDQNFQSNSYADFGSKTLTLRLDGGKWLIIAEEFVER